MSILLYSYTPMILYSYDSYSFLSSPFFPTPLLRLKPRSRSRLEVLSLEIPLKSNQIPSYNEVFCPPPPAIYPREKAAGQYDGVGLSRARVLPTSADDSARG